MKPTKISQNIQKGGKTSMLTLSNASDSGTELISDLSWEATAGNPLLSSPNVSFDPVNNTVLFFVGYTDKTETSIVGATDYTSSIISNESKYIWAYSIKSNRWDLWELSKDLEAGVPFVSQTGDVCISIGLSLIHI